MGAFSDRYFALRKEKEASQRAEKQKGNIREPRHGEAARDVQSVVKLFMQTEFCSGLFYQIMRAKLCTLCTHIPCRMWVGVERVPRVLYRTVLSLHELLPRVWDEPSPWFWVWRVASLVLFPRLRRRWSCEPDGILDNLITRA